MSFLNNNKQVKYNKVVEELYNFIILDSDIFPHIIYDIKHSSISKCGKYLIYCTINNCIIVEHNSIQIFKQQYNENIISMDFTNNNILIVCIKNRVIVYKDWIQIIDDIYINNIIDGYIHGNTYLIKFENNLHILCDIDTKKKINYKDDYIYKLLSYDVFIKYNIDLIDNTCKEILIYKKIKNLNHKFTWKNIKTISDNNFLTCEYNIFLKEIYLSIKDIHTKLISFKLNEIDNKFNTISNLNGNSNIIMIYSIYKYMIYLTKKGYIYYAMNFGKKKWKIKLDFKLFPNVKNIKKIIISNTGTNIMVLSCNNKLYLYNLLSFI